MENESKALLIAGAVLIAILIISMAIIIYKTNATSTYNSVNGQINDMELTRINNQYKLYEGLQRSNSVKELLESVIRNNTEMYDQGLYDNCVCIRSDNQYILKRVQSVSDANIINIINTLDGTNTRNGLKDHRNIRLVANIINDQVIYKISFNYNENGYIWEIHID